MKLAAVFCTLLVSWSCSAFELIAHRANARGAVENSVAGVKASWAAGADAIEIDVRMSRDRVVYLYHDDDIDGNVVTELDHAEVEELTSTEHVPLLRSVLDVKGAAGKYVLDLKSFEPENVELLASVIADSPFPADRLILQSDNLAVLDRASIVLPDCQYFYLHRLRRALPFFFRPSAGQIVTKLAGRKLHGISLKGRRSIDEHYVNTLSASGLTVYVWTINNIGRVKYYRRIGVDGVITDFVEDMSDAVAR